MKETKSGNAAAFLEQFSFNNYMGQFLTFPALTLTWLIIRHTRDTQTLQYVQ